jgi:hypothetical protein
LVRRQQTAAQARDARDLTDDAREIDKIAGQLQWLADFIKRQEKVTRGAGE